MKSSIYRILSAFAAIALFAGCGDNRQIQLLEQGAALEAQGEYAKAAAQFEAAHAVDQSSEEGIQAKAKAERMNVLTEQRELFGDGRRLAAEGKMVKDAERLRRAIQTFAKVVELDETTEIGRSAYKEAIATKAAYDGLLRRQATPRFNISSFGR